jgi:hypothetical protein
MPPSMSFSPSSTFPPPPSRSEFTPAAQETRERTTSRARGRSKSKSRVTFAPDHRSGSGSVGGVNDPAGALWQGTDGSPPMTRGRNQTKGVERGAPRPQSNSKGKSKAGEADQDPELGVDDTGNEGSVDRHLSPKSRSEVRGRTAGPGQR